MSYRIVHHTVMLVSLQGRRLGLVLEYSDGLLDCVLLLVAELDTLIKVLKQGIAGLRKLPKVRDCSLDVIFVAGLILLKLSQICFRGLQLRIQPVILSDEIGAVL